LTASDADVFGREPSRLGSPLCRTDVQGEYSGNIGADRDRFVSSEVSGFLAGPSIDLSNGDSGALAGELDCGSATDPVTGAGDEG
jgi:hypothetical protein